jgi:hypothetical protein
MAKNNSNLVDRVCQFGQTCYCNPSFGQRLSKIFITISIVLLIITIIAYLIYLNRNKLALLIAPKLYYDSHGELPDKKIQSENSRVGSQ